MVKLIFDIINNLQLKIFFIYRIPHSHARIVFLDYIQKNYMDHEELCAECEIDILCLILLLYIFTYNHI
jgi:hypothetical protein